MGVIDDKIPGPGLAQAHHATTAEEWRDALAACDTVLDIHPRHADALAARGAALRALGRPLDALESLLEALDVQSGHSIARQELALALRDAGRRDEARTLYTLLLRDAEAPAALWHDLGLFVLTEGKRDAAETCLRRAVAMAPETPRFRQSLADLLAALGRHEAARDLYHGVLALAPGSPDALAGLGKALVALGRLDEAEDQFERALAADGANAQARMGRARLNLLAGNWPGAWEDLDWRWSLPGLSRPEPPGIPWDGNTDLHGETILLWAEQGLADTIHLLRFVPRVAARGARVVLGLPRALLPLAQGLAGVVQAVASGAPLPEGLAVGFNASLADLPRLLGMSLNDAPAAPFLTLPDEARPTLAAPATAMLKVGLVWANLPGGGTSVPLPEMMPLLGLGGAAFFALQTGPRGRDAAELLHPALLADVAPATGDFGALAERMAAMDLIVAIDGPAAHLAGALGLPVWVVAPMDANWHWMLQRDDSSLYPSARLFRQTRPDNWNRPVQELCRALRDRIAEESKRRQEQAEALSGGDAAEHAFLAAHLRPGDVFVDAGCGAGALSAGAAAHDGVHVLAVDARAALAAALPHHPRLTAITAALGRQGRPAVVAAQPKAGRVVFPLPAWVRARTRTTTLDDLLAAQPGLAGRRLVLRLGARAAQADILADLNTAPAVVLFTHRAGDSAANTLGRQGYALYRFPEAVAAGPLAAFDGRNGPVLALGPGDVPAPLYGDTSTPHSPAAMAHARAEAARLSAEGTEALMAGRLNEAGTLFSRALHADPGNAQANANLGSLLRRIGRGYAAACCWRRALAGGADTGIQANLANVLREMGYPEAAAGEFQRLIAAEPDNPRILYAFGLLERDRGHAQAAFDLFDRAEHLAPGTVPRHELAAALLKAGNLARGMAEMAFRPAPSLPPVDAPAWDGGRLEARTILVRDEGNVCDTLMLARFIPHVARQGGLVVVECAPEAARLLAGLPGVEQAVPRGQPLPPVDCAVNLLDVPRLLGTTSRTTPLRDVPYLAVPDGIAPRDVPLGRRLRVGVAWDAPSVPAQLLLGLAAIPGITVVGLRPDTRLEALGVSAFAEDAGAASTDLADTAAVIAGLDLVVAADTPEAHLAGALGKPVWVLLPQPCHWRWVDGRDDSVWYPTMRVFRRDESGGWTNALARLHDALAALAAAKRRG